MHERFFKLKLSLLLVLLILESIGCCYFLMRQDMLFGPLFLGVLILITIFSILAYIDKSSRELTRFLLSLRAGAFTDFSQTGSFNNNIALSETLNEVTREFAKVNMEKELQFQYLHTLNENMGVGIITLNNDGSVRTINPAAKKMLRISRVESLEKFEHIDKTLHATMCELRPEGKRVIKMFQAPDTLQIYVQMKELVLNRERVKIYFLQNINDELDEKELQAWQQLVQVLTHEIMNSVTPIASLSKAVQSILKDKQGPIHDLSVLDEQQVGDIYESLDTIERRSSGLIRFVSSYKQFARHPRLNKEEVSPLLLIKRLLALLEADFHEAKIHVEFESNDDITSVPLDVPLIEQVLINLMKNAIEAVDHDGSGTISVRLLSTTDHLVIQIIDNGKGIPAEMIDKIFVPFFTTKDKGTGIGLSLSRQIVKLHQGIIKVTSSPGHGSQFSIELPSHS